jgi:NADPH:quinone reductase-like Zn-dependent oxidoreductase
MKAISYREYGDPDVLEYGDRPEPKLGFDSVLVKVRASSVNPVDWKVLAGYLDPALEAVFPVIPGWDVAGVVEKAGASVTEFKPGDEVVGYVREDFVSRGTFAEYVAAPIRALARKPENVSFEQAAGLPLAGLTAYQALHRSLKVREGETVLVHAAAGGVGSLAVQIARAQGVEVIGTASARNHDYLRSLGATPVEYGEGLAERVREAAPNGVDAVLDLVGGEALQVSPGLLAEGGRLASIADGGVLELGGDYVFVRPDPADLLTLTEMVERGDLRIEVAAVYPLEKAADAFRESIGGHTRGKIAITVA